MNALALALFAAPALSQQTVFVEAEAFSALGGWKIDTHTTLTVGSPYLLAHGLGRPVEDASTTIEIPDTGTYRVWVRTKDWVAPWGASGDPGSFQLKIGERPLEVVFGTEGADWHWQDGGAIELERGSTKLTLCDLKGFDARCDAILLTTELDTLPPTGEDLAKARRDWNSGGMAFESHQYDLVVIGGGYAGIAAAISAARQSLSVALIQDRFVLGGNGSSEVRVWANGGTMRGKYPHLGEIVEEFADHAPDSPGAGEHFGDQLKEEVCRREKNLTLFLGYFANRVLMHEPTSTIKNLFALNVRTGVEEVFLADYFVDCTGHGTIGALAGAEYVVKEDGRMGMSNMWYWQEVEGAREWPETPWALALEKDDFPGTPGSRSRIDGQPFFKGEWFWESGFDLDPIEDLELIRDWNLRAVYGAFSSIKKEKPNAQLEWVAHVGGTRESRLLTGDVVLTREDIVSKRYFPDGTVPTTWDIDLHYPKEQYAKKFPGNPFISRAEFGAGVSRDQGYPVPYRCFYSKNVPNLFMAGRCISVTHDALGTVRVMRTCGMMGEVVGRAAYLCVRESTSPRGVYEDHLDELLELQRQPGAMRRDTLAGELYRDASIASVRSYRTKGEDVVDGIEQPKPGIDVSSLAGIVIDDSHATLSGAWHKGSLRPCVGDGYRYANAGADATASFGFEIREAGRYEVKLAWVGHENRGDRVLCTVKRDGFDDLSLRLDQREEGELFHALGTFDFDSGPAQVVLSASDAKGCVHADAVQVLKAK